MYAKWSHVLDAQLECWQFWSSDYYVERLLSIWRESEGHTPKNVEITAILAREMLPMLEPVFISEDIVELASQACQSFEMEPFYEQDFFTSHGFAVLEKPYVWDRNDGVRSEINYIWWLWAQEEDQPATGLLVMSGDSQADGEILNTHPSFRWVPQAMTRMSNGEAPIDDARAGKSNPITFLQALLRLAQQPLAEHAEAAADRPTRRRVQRAGGTPRPITTITLRHPKGTPTGPPGTAHYSHRFMVHGFWRNQWYPSLQTHRQIWISDFVKGPADAPLVLKHRRFDFRR